MKNAHRHFQYKVCELCEFFAFTAEQNERATREFNFFFPSHSNHSKSLPCQEQMRPYPAARERHEKYTSPYRKRDRDRQAETHTSV
jgi:hypothetical protein